MNSLWPEYAQGIETNGGTGVAAERVLRLMRIGELEYPVLDFKRLPALTYQSPSKIT